MLCPGRSYLNSGSNLGRLHLLWRDHNELEVGITISYDTAIDEPRTWNLEIFAYMWVDDINFDAG